MGSYFDAVPNDSQRFIMERVQTDFARSLILAANGDTVYGGLSGIVVTAGIQDHASVR
jgi:hypothetical protein